MGQHRRAQVLTPAGEQSKQRSIQHDDEHEFPTIVGVTQAEKYGLTDQACRAAASPGAKLLHQVSAEDEFFTKSTSRRDDQVHRKFQRRLGHDASKAGVGVGMKQKAQSLFNRNDHDNKPNSESQIF